MDLPQTQTILSGNTSSHYTGVAMKQTLMSSQLSNYVGIRDPMYKTSYSRMVLPAQSPKEVEPPLGGWEYNDSHPLKVAKVKHTMIDKSLKEKKKLAVMNLVPSMTPVMKTRLA